MSDFKVGDKVKLKGKSEKYGIYIVTSVHPAKGQAPSYVGMRLLKPEWS